MSVNKILSKETLHRVISLIILQSTFMYLPSPLNNLLYIMYILHTFVCIVLYKELFSYCHYISLYCSAVDARHEMVHDLLKSEREYGKRLRSILDTYAEPLR